jgi:hypothetical protein
LKKQGKLSTILWIKIKKFHAFSGIKNTPLSRGEKGGKKA